MNIGMSPLVLAVLNGEYSWGLRESLSRAVSIRGNVPR